MNNNKKNYIDALNEIKIDESIKKKVINDNYRKSHYKFNLKLVTSVAMAAVILLFIIGFNDTEINKSYESGKELDKKYEILEDNLASEDNSYKELESEKVYKESIVLEAAKPNKNTSSGSLGLGIKPNTASTSAENIKMEGIDMKVNKKIIIGAITLITVIIVSVVLIKKSKFNPKVVNEAPSNVQVKLEESNSIIIVPTLQETLKSNSAWCCTFQLVWNDMKNELVKQDVVFEPQLDVVVNLNQEEFKENMISDNYYYKKFGEKSPNLKAEIEKGIEDKFGETSDVLDKIKWEELNNDDVKEYVFYAMLKREFEFSKEFDELAKGKFGTKYDDVSYFGVNADTNYKVKNQVDVLYYNSKDDFAIILNTKQNDEVILCKNPEGKTFDEIYDNMNDKAKGYKGKKYLENIDELKVPNLKFDEIISYEELKSKKFLTADGEVAYIAEAIQTIQFELNKKGGKIKSEAIIDVNVESSAYVEDVPEPRYFYLDDTFAIFLREQGKDLPYFAARIDDIIKFQ